MRLPLTVLAAVAALVFALARAEPAAAGFLNRSGCGIYTPEGPPAGHRPRLYRHDLRSWCYKPRGWYPYYGSGYWVPRAEMRYRYRYHYRGPLYTYYPAWGYGW